MAALEMPGMLVQAFDGDQELEDWVRTLRESWQREIARWVMEPKSDHAKQRRCLDWAERLLLTMEAERELPAFLLRRLNGTRYAAAGWEAMSVDRKRDYLLVLFGAKGAEARENQITRLVEAASAKGARERKLTSQKRDTGRPGMLG